MLQKNPKLTIPLNNPFQNDQLERDKVADNLTLLAQSTTQPFVISLQAPSGWGKTTFIKMWKAQMEVQGHICFYFNAWENDFVSDPLIAFVGEINKTVADKSLTAQVNSQLKKLQNFGGKLVRRAPPLTIQIATQGLLPKNRSKKRPTSSLPAEARSPISPRNSPRKRSANTKATRTASPNSGTN
ncbi:MAG: hypothetical protein HXY38_03775 [Chloroflexi bacterium]|nr:hypothetical protein [Chloroflexota bacterium]